MAVLQQMTKIRGRYPYCWRNFFSEKKIQLWVKIRKMNPVIIREVHCRINGFFWCLKDNGKIDTALRMFYCLIQESWRSFFQSLKPIRFSQEFQFFDRETVSIEIARNYYKMVKQGCQTPEIISEDIFNYVDDKKVCCTIIAGKSEHDLFIETFYEKRYLKNSKLSQLHHISN